MLFRRLGCSTYCKDAICGSTRSRIGPGRRRRRSIVCWPQENDYIPAISTLGMTDDSDVRIQPHWWMPNLDRRSIWSGTTILILGGSTHVQEETWLVNGGAQIEYMDIVTRPPANQAAFSKKVAPIRDKAAKARRANKSANATGELLVAFYVYEDLERLEAKWEGNGLAAILLGGLES